MLAGMHRRLLALSAVLACNPADTPEAGESEESSGGASSGAGEAEYTYYRDVAPILASKCTSCHSAGNIAPFALESAAEARMWAPALAAAVMQGTMPPWPPDPACNSYAHDRSLSDEQRAAIVGWAEAGAPEGDASDAAPAPEPPPAIDYDMQLQLPVAYTPTIAPDEYRCFVLDWPAEQRRFVTGLEVHPGEPAIVHHLIAFIAPPAEVATFTELDAADPDPGYLCYGGPGGGRPGWLGAWVPGGAGGALPEGTGIRVEPGSKIVVQMHYHTLPGAGPDRSTLALRTAEAVEKEAFMLPFTNPKWISGEQPMTIPAGAAAVEHAFELDMSAALPLLAPSAGLPSGTPLRVHALALHMHTLGVAGSITVAGPGGDRCGLTIPRWDFNWQGNYRLREPMRLVAGDRVRLACEWDNSPAHQPVVDGAPQAPREVQWGEGTGDEMCLGTVLVTAD